MVSEDFRKFYEFIEWPKLLAECARWGFQEAFTRCAARADGAARVPQPGRDGAAGGARRAHGGGRLQQGHRFGE
eukprot:8862946-Lingulodinium_polyedra.AAC.1